MSFKKNKYCVAKKVVSKELALFCFNYLLIAKAAAKTLRDKKQISDFDATWGVFNDQQVDGTWSKYVDIAMETLLLKLLPVMEKETGLKLIPTYAYTRLYKTGDELKRHKDRPSCEVSTTLFLGGDEWPIFLSPNENVGGPGSGATWSSDAKGIAVNLKQGDMLIYDGVQLEHWREKFKGEECAQVFLHYNTDTKENKIRENDTRPCLGTPAYMKLPKF